ncbi:d0711c98-185d-4612-9a97-d953f49e8c55 [Sclerotinia trifoliorum]|uniref:D0711c98-185d-4612-9a97-d953f49e8c55 n=1 Tax=Sclerotinia trifoliorum TaxID=28548 RepID=A0A8H2W403_9HELO|nr:d0711c98-185d-4612-9a97-d953f49e8c55 [Sclerotinia trifoliorum]
MARPYITTSDKNGSLLNPMSAGSSTPISYRANVNRQKTKKWAEAKKIDYGGDDWGDDDEYDPYNAYGNEPDPAPAPVSKPIGLRQQGQGLASMREMSQERGQKSYGSLPTASAGSALRRRNSFEADDETRHFSNSTIRQEPAKPSSPPPSAGSANVPATRFSQMGVGGIRHTRDPSGPPSLHISTEQPSPTSSRKPLMSVNPAPPEALYNNDPMSPPARTYTNESSILSAGSVNSLSDYETSKDFSPSAVPAPLHMRAPSASQGATNGAPSTKYPARKSSLSTVGTEAQRVHQMSQETVAKPLAASPARSPSPGSADRSTTTPGASNTKPSPFIRPADIYRRVEERKQERERSSSDLARPSLDSIGMERSSDGSRTPGQAGTRERSSSDSLGPGNRGKNSFGDEDSESGRRLTPILEPVNERKSEYDFEGFNANEIPSPDQDILNPLPESKTTSPTLPDLHRISGFGSDFFSQSKLDSEAALPAELSAEQPERMFKEYAKPPDDTSLRSHPSFGFKSVVNQAFDSTSDDLVSPIPASKTGSEVRRSDSESTGTTEISPIMSHGPSTTVSDNRSREMSTPAIMELVEPASPHPQDVTHEHDDQIVPPDFIPGHRRDISTPSPGNSPARTPDLGTASKRISMGEHAWISSASPTAEDEIQNTEPEPTRPTIDREESFRPQLPGGWQSYTTTATTSTVQPESARSQSPQIPNDPVQDLAAEDLTPTTAKHSLPESSIDAARVTLGVKSDAMPTPDANGNVHSAMTPHPELIPALQRASPEAQLRPDFTAQSVPTESSPTPSSKGERDENAEDASEDLPSPGIASQESTAEAIDTNELLLPPSRPQVLPTLSTDTGPFDEQSDKLRKEIVKRLSILPSESEVSHENVHERLDAPNTDHPRESAYLTDVYDDYWNGTGDEEHSSSIGTTSLDKPQTEQTIPIDMPEIRPLSSHRMSRQQTRTPLPTRFSWEMSMESVHQVNPDMPEPPRSHVELPVENYDEPHEGLRQVDPEPYMEKEVFEGPSYGDRHYERDVALATDATTFEDRAAAATLSTTYLESAPTVNVSLAQEKQQPQFASYTVTQTPENEQPAHVSTLDVSTDPLWSSPHSSASIPSPLSARESATSPRTSNLGKVLTWKEILGIKDVHERVHAFDETRERFADMDSGIHDWIFALKAEQPEHADVNESYGGFTSSVPTGSTRRNTRSASGSMQSPYFQQYLNSSAPSQSSTSVSRPGQTGAPGNQQGFSPAHAKITSQQVQAKGKEFLHHAGMFGGKAGKAGFQAGKGLLAKGKNRLRAAGSSDKTSPPPKPRHPNRSSWGLALSLSRATGRTDPSQHTEQNLPSEPTSRSRVSTSSDVLTPIGIIDAPASDEEARASHAEEVNVVSRETAGEILAPGGTEEQQLVNLPAPMSEYKPTWDADHATHITKEGHLDKGWQTDHYSPDPESTNKLFAPAGSQMGARSNCDNATEQQAGWPPKDAVAASSLIVGGTMEHKAGLKPLDRSLISMMNRPRGASLDQVINPDQPSRTATRSLQAPLPIQPTSQKISGIEEQGRQPSFKTLPPIRRTSKFGFEFGSRRPQTRFPISDDEDDDVSNGYIQDVAHLNTMVGSSDHTSQQNARTDVSIVNKAPVSKPNVHTVTQPRFSVFPRVADPFVHKNHGQDVERSNPAMGHTRQNSWNSLSKISRPRRGSTSDQQSVQRRNSNAPPPMIPALPFESPPSSTQRYPELFGGPAAEVQDDYNMPGGYYQAPRGRTEALTPRQPSSEISGARPSQNNEEPVGHRRRRSSDLVSRGMNFVRSISRERRSSVSRERKGPVSRDGEIPPMDTFATPPSRDGRQRKRGSGFWGSFDITGEQSSDSPIGRESMVAHYSGSQSNLMASPHESPRTPKSPNPNPTLETPNSNIVGRSTTTMGKTLQRDDKRGRLAGLSGLFSRSPKGDGSVLFKPKRATTDLSSFSPRGGTLSSPQLEAQTTQDANIHHKRRPSQPLNFLSKFAPSPSLQKTENPSQDKKDRTR